MSDKLSLVAESSSQQNSKPWYHKGLRFKCTECGKCCTGSPGYVWVSIEEIEAIAAYLNMSTHDFGAKHLRKIGDRYALLEKGSEYSCAFLQGKTCRIYPVRPTQCRTFPWWAGNVASPEAWQNASLHCEGIRPDAPIISQDVIEANLARNGP